MGIIFSNEILSIAILVLGYIVIFRVSADVKFLHKEIEKLQTELANIKDKE